MKVARLKWAAKLNTFSPPDKEAIQTNWFAIKWTAMVFPVENHQEYGMPVNASITLVPSTTGQLCTAVSICLASNVKNQKIDLGSRNDKNSCAIVETITIIQ